MVQLELTSDREEKGGQVDDFEIPALSLDSLGRPVLDEGDGLFSKAQSLSSRTNGSARAAGVSRPFVE
jgi:hypothetical protein